MSGSEAIRILLVDDHAVVRSGLAAFLLAYDDLELVGEAGGGEEAVRLCEQLQPDVVLMDLVMPGMDGVAATRVIRDRFPDIQVLALTSFKEKELVEGVLQAGAIGYLLKNIPARELVEAVRAAHAGRPTISPEAVQTLILAEKLERLARAMIAAPPDGSGLPDLLREHVPALFPESCIEVRIFPDQVLLRSPADWPSAAELAWEWLATAAEAQEFLPAAALPWGGRLPLDEGLIVAPILDVEGLGRPQTTPIGGVYLSQGRDPEKIGNVLPAIQALAGQVASALHSASVYEQTLAREKLAQELAIAWEIQASFLPTHPPEVVGWDIEATLVPARETSGDFYDFIALPEGKWGIVIADVADKGMGAALYMALGCTLIRTYAAEYHARPDLVLSAVNRRLLSDTQADLFVTVFYGVLDPATGTLSYCNAGHDPPYLLCAQQQADVVQTLPRTGMLLGVEQDGVWEQASLEFAPGDVLLLYTDGITEAQNQRGEFFGKKRLLRVIQASRGRSAQDIRDDLIAAVHQFAGEASQMDDLTMIIISRGS